MSDVNWLPGIVVLGVSTVGGAWLAFRSRDAAPATDTRRVDERRADLLARKDELLGLLRELDDTRASRTPEVYAAERARLEREAAEAMRSLDLVGKEPLPEAAAASATPGDAAPAAPGRTISARNPQLVGAMWGAGAVLFLGALAWGLNDASTERGDGGSMTGGPPGMGGGMSGGRAPQASAPAAPATPAEEPQEVKDLEAQVAAQPDDLELKNKLGHAKIGLNEVMDAFHLAEDVVKKDPQNAEARTHQGVALMATGNLDMAGQVFDAVLKTSPSFTEALGYRGAVYYQKTDLPNAIATWEKAKAAAPDEAATFDKLIAMAKQGPSPLQAPAAGGGMAASAPEASSGPAEFTGEVRLGDGVASIPGTLYVYVRPAGVTGGPPARVKRLPDSFPAAFSISAADSPMGGALSGPVQLSARLDADGNPMTHGPDDLTAISEPVQAGATGVVLTLQKAQ